MEKLRPEQLREKANMLPLLPGVYIMLDEHGEVIYICLLYTSPSPRD